MTVIVHDHDIVSVLDADYDRAYRGVDSNHWRGVNATNVMSSYNVGVIMCVSNDCSRPGAIDGRRR